MAQPGAQPRLARHHDAEDHDGDRDKGERPHRLMPTHRRRDDDRQNDGAKNEPLGDAVQREGEPLPHKCDGIHGAAHVGRTEQHVG